MSNSEIELRKIRDARWYLSIAKKCHTKPTVISNLYSTRAFYASARTANEDKLSLLVSIIKEIENHKGRLSPELKQKITDFTI